MQNNPFSKKPSLTNQRIKVFWMPALSNLRLLSQNPAIKCISPRAEVQLDVILNSIRVGKLFSWRVGAPLKPTAAHRTNWCGFTSLFKSYIVCGTSHNETEINWTQQKNKTTNQILCTPTWYSHEAISKPEWEMKREMDIHFSVCSLFHFNDHHSPSSTVPSATDALERPCCLVCCDVTRSLAFVRPYGVTGQAFSQGSFMTLAASLSKAS